VKYVISAVKAQSLRNDRGQFNLHHSEKKTKQKSPKPLPACRMRLMHPRGMFSTRNELQDEQCVSENTKEL